MNASFKNIFKASGAASLGQILNILNQLALVPLYIKVWGTPLYGEWLILSAAPSVIAMAGDFGFGTVAANEMNIAVARDDKNYALKVFQNNWLVISAFSILFLVVAGIGLALLPVNTSLNLHLIADNDAKLIIALFLFTILLSQQNVLLMAALRCDGNYVAGLLVGNIGRLVELVLVAVLLFAYHAAPLTLVITLTITGILTTFTNWVLVRTRSPWIKHGTQHFSMEIIKVQTPQALSFLSFPITQAFSIQGTVILVGYLLNPAAVVVLTTTRTFMNVIKQVVAVVNSSIWPEMTTAFGQHDSAKFQNIFIRAVQAVALIVVCFNLSIWLVGKPIYQFWTKHKVDFDGTFFYAFAAVTSISALWSIFGMVQNATNNTKKFAVYNLCSLVILLLGITFTSKIFGLQGVLATMFVAESFMLIFVMRTSLHILNVPSLAGFFKLRQRSVAVE
jgi:O-antigen/teichoic acid export membrane protein